MLSVRTASINPALNEAGCRRIFEEKISTRKAATDRPGLRGALDYLRPGDTLCIWKLDRLGRSVKDVLTIADDLHEQGIGVRILTGRLAGTYQPSGEGKFFFTMMAAFAELERDIIHERTMAGLAAARAQGRVGGRPTVVDADKLAAAQARYDRGESPTRIAKAGHIACHGVPAPVPPGCQLAAPYATLLAESGSLGGTTRVSSIGPQNSSQGMAQTYGARSRNGCAE